MQIRSILCVAALAGVASWSPTTLADDAGVGGPPAVAAPGQEPSGGVHDTNLDDSTPWGGSDGNTLKVSLADAIALGLENNLGIQVQRFDPLISEEDMSIAWGAYDPVWASELGWDEDRSPNSFTLNGASSGPATSSSTRKMLRGVRSRCMTPLV